MMHYKKDQLNIKEDGHGGFEEQENLRHREDRLKMAEALPKQ